MRSLPRIVSGIPSDVRNFLDRVREYLGEGGDGRFVTLRELKAGGIVGTTPGGTITTPGAFGVEDPSQPKNLTVTGAFATIIVEWDTPDYLGHSYTEVWAAATDDFTIKELVGVADGNIFSHSIGTGATRYYWVRFVNTLNVAGPFNATAGTVGSTSQDPDYLIEVLSDAYGVTGPAPFFQIDTPTVINGVLIPAGTYIKQAWIADATISRAKIQDLAVDSAKISDLSADKITTASLQVGASISSQGYVAGTSGWKINADGTAEFANGIFRGNIYGSGATSYGVGTGLFSGTDTFTVTSLTRSSTTATATTSVAHGLVVGNTVTISGVTNDTAWNGTYTVTTVPSTTQFRFTVSSARVTPATGTLILATVPYRFRVGNPAGNKFTWDGSTLTITGTLSSSTISGGTISGTTLSGSTLRSGTASAYMTGEGFWVSGSEFRVGDPEGNYMRWTGTALEVVGPVIGTTNIASNGVTTTQFSSNSSAIDFGTLAEQTVATTPTVVIPGDAAAVLINYSLAYYADTSNSFDMTIRIYRGTTLLKTTVVRIKSNIDQVVSNIHVDDAPSAGSVTYKVTSQVTAGGTPSVGNLQILANQGTIVATLLKR